MLIYLHGFNSSSESRKAQLLKRFLQQRGLGAQYRCPELPHLPRRAIAVVETEIARHAHTAITLIGSSLGGFYSTYLAERHDLRAVLINPAVYPHEGLRAYLGVQRNLFTQQQYQFTEDHLRQWQQLYLHSIHPQRYLLLLETGDEVLDYREAVKKYQGARRIVVNGGDHSLTSFPEHLPLILEFAGLVPARTRSRQV